MKIPLTILGVLIATGAFAEADTNEAAPPTKKPWAVGFAMNGTVTNVVEEGDKIYFQFAGWFYMDQISSGGTNQVIRVDCRNGVFATVTATDFVATVPNANAAAAKKKEHLAPILKAAAERRRELKIRLLSPKLDFGAPSFLQDAQVWRITDWDLR